jgi:ubiquinone/menaquinone biosynthesis C-methylase UbiE
MNMSPSRWISSFKNTFGRGVFPHQMSFVLDLLLRRTLLSPQKLTNRLALTATSHVLEVGAGSGFYSVEAASSVSRGHFELVDIQLEMLKKARHKLEAERLFNAGFTVADAARLPFRNDCFDLLFLVAVFGEIVKQHEFLSEAYRVLKPGGVLSISEHLPDPDFSQFTKVKLIVERGGFRFFERHGVRWNYTANFTK